MCVCEEVPVYNPGACSSIPISGVNPRSLPGVVVDEKHSAVVVPGFLPACGQRQLRALPPLSAAHPRHSVGDGERGLRALYLPCSISTPHTGERKQGSSLHYSRKTRSASRGLSGRERATFPPSFCKSLKSDIRALLFLISPFFSFYFFSTRSSSVLHVRLLHHISFLRVHIRVEEICINGRT